MFPSDEQNLAVWDTPRGRWRSQLSHPGVGAHKHHDTFVFITSFHSLLCKCEENRNGEWNSAVSRRKGRTRLSLSLLFLAACIHSLGWDLCALGCDSGMLTMSG